AFHIAQTRRLLGDCAVIAVMSGNFVQRGEPALVDKYARTKAALSCGADLVLELPSCFSAGSAEYFARSAISMLDHLGMIDFLCFGSECSEIQFLSQFADIFLKEPEPYKKILLEKLKLGYSYPTARSNALVIAYPELAADISVISSPNNILGIEYIKALHRRRSPIHPVNIRRIGSDHRDQRLGPFHSSSRALRLAIQSNRSIEELHSQMPEEAYGILTDYFDREKPLFQDDFSTLLHYKLLSEQAKGYTDYLDITPDLSDKICKYVYQYTTFSEFCDLLKSKDMTYTRISRCLLHILLNITKDNMQFYIDNQDAISYARLLGFREDAKPLLTAIDKNTSIPLITKMADAEKLLTGGGQHMFQQEVQITDIYSSIQASKAGHKMYHEYTRPMIVI
ncbi:MAG: nucleotidyltransferase family protein, partial [Acetatifactor sp.]|nr:nucleotidyltransferase family protein [Acetatifactor sp.]